MQYFKEKKKTKPDGMLLSYVTWKTLISLYLLWQWFCSLSLLPWYCLSDFFLNTWSNFWRAVYLQCLDLFNKFEGSIKILKRLYKSVLYICVYIHTQTYIYHFIKTIWDESEPNFIFFYLKFRRFGNCVQHRSCVDIWAELYVFLNDFFFTKKSPM